MFNYVIEVLIWSFAIYGFIDFVKENFTDFVGFLRKICRFMCKKCTKFVAKKNR